MRFFSHEIVLCIIVEFEVYDMILYENVSQVPEYRRKTLVLIGPQYIGRKSLKGRLIADNPTGFGQVMPCEHIIRVACSVVYVCVCVCVHVY